MEVNLGLSEISKIVGGNLVATDDSFVIKKIASLENATKNDLSIILDRGDASVFDAVSLKKIKNCNAGCFLTFSSKIVEGKNYILVDDTTIAFQKLVEYLQKIDAAQKLSTQISSTAEIASSAFVGDGTIIGDESKVGAQVSIGRCCKIGSNVKLYPGVKILDYCIVGDNTIIHAGAIIGSDGFGYKVTKYGLIKIPQIGIVRIGKFVEIGAICTLDRATFDETLIGDGVKMDNMVHIAHNVKIGNGTAILAQTGIAGGTSIGSGCQIGGQVAIKNDIRIGNGVKIVSKSAVMHNLEDGAIVCGVPAIPFTKWKRISVLINKLPEFAKFFESSGKISPWYTKLFSFLKKT